MFAAKAFLLPLRKNSLMVGGSTVKKGSDSRNLIVAAERASLLAI